MAEGESGGFGTNSADRHKNSHSVSQKKRLSPLKHGTGGGPRKKAEQESRTRVKPTGWTCGECLQWFPERDAYVSHVKTTHRKVSRRRRSVQNQRSGPTRKAVVEPFSARVLRRACVFLASRVATASMEAV